MGYFLGQHNPSNYFALTEIQLDSLGCKLNLLVYLAELSVQGYAISSVTEFNSNGTKPRVAYANDKNFKKIVKYYSTKEA